MPGITRNNPMQPVVLDERGTPRFKENAIVRYLIDLCRDRGIADMNTLAIIPFSREDREQFAQLIGYSVSGAGDLSYVSDEVYEAAALEAKALKTP
jgi:hypothetical protein